MLPLETVMAAEPVARGRLRPGESAILPAMPATLVTDVPGVSCGAYFQLTLGAALARIAECAPAAEIR